jgi:hypothetical protein
MIEGSGAGSGSVPLTNGSGSGMSKRIWIRNTDTKPSARVYIRQKGGEKITYVHGFSAYLSCHVSVDLSNTVCVRIADELIDFWTIEVVCG